MKVKVLIADGSAVVRARLKELLADLADVELVGEADNSSAAMDLFISLKPDVIIADVRLPGANRKNLLHLAKQARPDAIIILLAVFPYPEYRNACLERGADFYFDKSSEFEKLTKVVQSLTLRAASQPDSGRVTRAH